MTKKSLMLLALPAMILASCGTKESSSPASSTSKPNTTSSTSTSETYVPKITTDTTIDIWSIIGKSNQVPFDKYIAAFEKLEPHVKINSTYQSTSYNGLKDMVVKGFPANNYPDLVQCYPDHVAEYLDYGKVVNLDTYINDATNGWTAADKADVIKAYQDEGTGYVADGTYSVPFCKSTEAMYYNADVLIGLDLSSVDNTINSGKALTETYLNNLTWEELFNKLCPAIVTYNNSLTAEKKIIKDFAPGTTGSGVFAYDSDDNLFITLAEQYGLKYTSIDKTSGTGRFDAFEKTTDADKANRTALEDVLKTFRTAAEKGYIISKGSSENNYTNTYFTKQNTLFSVGSTGGVSYQYTDNFATGVAKIPHAKDHDQAVISQGPSLCMLDHNDANKKLASWLFYKYMTNVTNATDWAVNTGYSAIRQSCYDTDAYADYSDTTASDKGSKDWLMANNASYVPKVTNDFFLSPAFKGSSTARTQAAAVMVKVLVTKSNDITKIDTWFDDALAACKLAA